MACHDSRPDAATGSCPAVLAGALLPLLLLLSVPGCGLMSWALDPAVTVGDALVPGASLHYELAGEPAGSSSAVVLLHGGETDRRLWDDQFLPFAQRHRVLRFDARGRGRSSGVSTPYRAHDDLTALLDALGLDRVHLVGLSLGSRVAVDFALAHPERVASLVLVSPSISGWNWNPAELGWMVPLFQAALEGRPERATELWLGSAYLAPAMADADVAERLRKIALDNAHIWSTTDREVEPWPSARRRLDELSGPLLIIVGEHDVPDTRRIAEALQAEAGDVRRTDWPGVGHLPNMERPDAFNDLVLQFLAKVDAAVG